MAQVGRMGRLLLTLALGGCGLFRYGIPLTHPEMPSRSEVSPGGSDSGVRVQFFGTASLFVRADSTVLLHDPFVSRPRWGRMVLSVLNPLPVGARVGPDSSRIKAAIDRLKSPRARAVITSHAHHDHGLDAGVFAARTGAVLVGSASVANLGHGAGLPPDKIWIANVGDTLRFPPFEIVLVDARHGRPELFPGIVDQPLETPARASSWRTGSVQSVLIRHGKWRLLIHGSGGYKAGALNNHCADVVYLGVGALGTKSEEEISRYWKEVVSATRAQRVVLIHWDDFFRSFDREVLPMFRPLDHLPRTLELLSEHAKREGVTLIVPELWKSTDPFAGLELSRCDTGA